MAYPTATGDRGGDGTVFLVLVNVAGGLAVAFLFAALAISPRLMPTVVPALSTRRVNVASDVDAPARVFHRGDSAMPVWV